MLGHPVNLRIIGEHLFAQIFHANIPGIDGSVDQRGVGALAEGIAVLDGGLMDQFAFVLKALNDRFVGVFAELPFVVRNLRGEFAVDVERLDERDAGGGADAVVVLTVSRRHMNDARSIFGGNKFVGQNAEGVLVALEVVEQRLIGQPGKLRTLELFEDFVLLLFFVVGAQAAFGQHEHIVAFGVADGNVVDVRPGTDGEVGRKRPRGGRPDQRTGVFNFKAVQFYAHGDGRVLHILIVAAGLEVGQRRVELPAEGHDAVGAINAALFPKFGKHPPDGLHEIFVHGFIVVGKVDPAAHAGDGFFPLFNVG